jgi:hypothetical protein
MSKEAFDRIREGLEEAHAWCRGEIALPITDFSSGKPITTVRHRGAPDEIGDRHAPQTEEAQER